MREEKEAILQIYGWIWKGKRVKTHLPYFENCTFHKCDFVSSFPAFSQHFPHFPASPNADPGRLISRPIDTVQASQSQVPKRNAKRKILLGRLKEP